jgi:hypothetical protein
MTPTESELFVLLCQVLQVENLQQAKDLQRGTTSETIMNRLDATVAKRVVQKLIDIWPMGAEIRPEYQRCTEFRVFEGQRTQCCKPRGHHDAHHYWT